MICKRFECSARAIDVADLVDSDYVWTIEG